MILQDFRQTSGVALQAGLSAG